MDVLSFVIVGHVDHGKSTLIGRLLYDTDSLAPDRIEEMKRASAGRGRETEFAYLLDHLEEERKQGITIDTTQVFFKSDKRRYVIIDAPGHVELVKNMITGASQAEAAILIIDAAEGVKEQTKRHSYMLSLMGLRQVVVVLNKMDLVAFSKERFDEVKGEAGQWLKTIGIDPLCYIPISAIRGENIARRSENMDWYNGPTFLEMLDTLKNKPLPEHKPFIMPIQDVYRIDEKRINAGRVEAGAIETGARVKILPTGETTEIKSIERFLAQPTRAVAGDCIGVITADSVLLERGSVLCLPGAEPKVTDCIPASIFWMSRKDLVRKDKLIIRCATQETSCKVESISKRIDSSTLEVIEENADVLKNLEVAEVVIRTKKPFAVTDFNDVQELGRFVFVQDGNICAGGIVTV